LIVRAVNPEDIPGFMERFKTESAHYLNRKTANNKY
jgi:molybdopterin biosynthesis enzyme MoaB